MKKILYYLKIAVMLLNIAVMLPFFLIGKCFESIACVCAWIMDKIDFRLNLINEEDEDISAE